jgi:Domain of unknown function (DUF222)/HNH endonuclease
MSEAAHDWTGEVDDLDPAAVLAALTCTETRVRQAEVHRLHLALQWCALHPATTDTHTATWAEPDLLGRLAPDESLGGQGTPGVCGFAPEPFAAVLGVSTHAGMQLLADALDLAHRLPRIWARVQALEVPVWKARQVATRTHSLSVDAAAFVDTQLAPRVHSAGYTTLIRLVDQAQARFDPQTQQTAEEAATAASGVELFARPEDGYAGASELRAVGDTLDLTRFHDAVNTLAHHLGQGGDDSPFGVRQITAMGMLAAGRGATGNEKPSGKTHLFVHLDTTDLDDEPLTQVGTVERLGPATRAKIISWLRLSGAAVVTPVIRQDRVDAVDTHDPPWWMAEQVILRDQTCRFPYCTRDARSCDLDHIVAYHPDGPPGQTRPDNLAPLCRRHHNAKTTRRWRYRRLPDDTYQWHGPWGSTYLVTPHGTHPDRGAGR